MNVNPCSACSLRYDKTDINNLNDCCFQTCAQFVDGSQQDVIQSECGQKCVKCVTQGVNCLGKDRCGLDPEIPSIRLTPKHFKECLSQTETPTEALSCCLNRSSNFEEQERCIDAYNALVEVKEGFILPKRIDRGLLFLGFILLISYLQFNGKVKFQTFQHQALIYTGVYYILHNFV